MNRQLHQWLLFLSILALSSVSHSMWAMQQKEVVMKIESPAFKHGQPIPEKYTCQGKDVSPHLIFNGIPKETVSLTLIVDDPDAPMGTFVHWLVWNIPGNTKELPEGVLLEHQGKNGFKDTRYRGPCPPPGGPHRYFFKLYALDITVTLPNGSLKSDLEKAIEGHVIGKAELVGTFQR